MKMKAQGSLKIAAARSVVVAVALTLGLGAGAGAEEPNPRSLVKAMSDYMAAQTTISYSYDSVLEVVTKDGQKLGLASSGVVTINHPDKMRATRAGGFADIEMVFDGKTLTMFGKTANLYTRIEIPGTIDHLIDELRDTYGRPLPAADLLKSDAYDQLMKEVIDAKDLGSGVIGGVECDFLAFRTKDVDWQIWIAQGDRPYPCKYVITSKHIASGPQYTIQIRDWKTGDEVAADDFDFGNSTNAKEISLKDLNEMMGDMPANFKKGDSQ